MATSKTKRSGRVVVMSTADTLLKQTTALYVGAIVGTPFREEMRVLIVEVEALVLKIKKTLEPMVSDDDNEIG